MRTKTLKKPIELTIGKKKLKIRKFELAPDKGIEKLGGMPYEFLRKVFGVKGALLTDESSIYDFDFTLDFDKKKVQHTTEKYLKKIKRMYGVDVSDVKGLTIVGVIKKIIAEQKKLKKEK